MALLATVERNRRDLRDMQSPLVRELAELYAETLEVLDQDIRALAEASRDRIAAGEAVPRSWIVQQETYQRISDQIEREIAQINRYARDTIGSQTAQATRLGEQHAQQLMLEGMGPRPATVNITFANLPVGAINEIMAQTGPGTPLYQLFEKLSSNGPDWARQALIEGVMRGRPPRRIGRDLQQELGRSLARSITIARTEVLRSYRESTRQTYAANPRVVKAYRWTAALDDRTCFPAGTMIRTRAGLRPIQDIQVGDEVMTHTGRYCRVVDTKSHNHEGSFISLNDEIVATPDHEFLIQREGGLRWDRIENLSESDIVFRYVEHVGDSPHGLFSRAVIQQLVGYSKNFISMCSQYTGFSLILALGARLLMPIQPVNLKDDVRARDIEINGIAPARRGVLLNVGDAQGFKALSNRPLWRRLACKAAIAGKRTEPATLLDFTGDLAKSLFARSTRYIVGWPPALFRAVPMVISARLERFPAPFAVSVQGVGGTALPGAMNVSSSLASFNGEGVSALRTSLCDSNPGRLAIHRAIFLRLIIDVNLKRLAAVFTRFRQSGTCDLPALCVWVLALIGSVARPATKLSRPVLDSRGRDVEDGAAGFAGAFHPQSISKIRMFTGKVKVYDLTVERDHSYVANGYVVHNCPACIMMHGTIHQVSEVFGTHPRCRCSLTPITASWEELGFEGIPDRRPSFQSGIEWFEKLPAARQRDILGPSKYEAWSAGEFDLPELVKYHDHPTWGPTRSEASLKSILGPKQAEEYYPAAAG